MKSKHNIKSFPLILCVLSLAMLITGVSLLSVNYNVNADATGELYYFVNCGEDGITDIETAYGLTGTLGSGDQAFASGWGYTSAGTAGGTSDSVFSSYRSGTVTYKFTLAAGTYQFALGFNSAAGATLSIAGTSKEAAMTLTEKTIKSYSVTVTAGDAEIAVTGGELSFIAIAADGAKILMYAEADSAEAVVYGEVINSKAAAYFSDGTTGEVGIDYSNLNAVDINRNFSMVDARAVIEGTDASISRSLFTVPQNLLYWVNCGSYETTNGNILKDVYYPINDAVFKKLDGTLINDVPDQVITGNTWGYSAYSVDFPTSSKQMPVKSGDPYPPAFPFNTIRCTSTTPYGITYTFTLPAEKNYNLYLGTMSHWHTRLAAVTINETDKGMVSLDGTNRVTKYSNLSPDSNNQIKISVIGPARQDEGMIAFIAIQEDNADNTPAAVPAKVSVPETLDLGTTSFEVGNITAGTKIQVSAGDRTNAVIYETIATNNEPLTVNLPAAKLNNLFRLNVRAISNGGASEASSVFITDVREFSVTPSTTGWTSGNVILDISGKSNSGIKRLVVTRNFESETIILNGANTYEGSYQITQNGDYEITLYSGLASISTAISITNIDRDPAALSISVGNTALLNGKIPVKPTVVSMSGVAKFEVFSNGVKLETLTSLPEYYMVDPGFYTFKVTTASGKMAAQNVQVSKSPVNFTLSKAVSGKTLGVTVETEQLKRLMVYKMNETNAERLNLTNENSFNIYDEGEYMIITELNNGVIEMSLVTLGTAKDFKGGSGCGAVSFNTSGFISGMALIIVFITIRLAVSKSKKQITA